MENEQPYSWLTKEGTDFIGLYSITVEQLATLLREMEKQHCNMPLTETNITLAMEDAGVD